MTTELLIYDDPVQCFARIWLQTGPGTFASEEVPLPLPQTTLDQIQRLMAHREASLANRKEWARQQREIEDAEILDNLF